MVIASSVRWRARLWVAKIDTKFRALAGQTLGGEDRHKEIRYNIVKQFESGKVTFGEFVQRLRRMCACETARAGMYRGGLFRG